MIRCRFLLNFYSFFTHLFWRCISLLFRRFLRVSFLRLPTFSEAEANMAAHTRKNTGSGECVTSLPPLLNLHLSWRDVTRALPSIDVLLLLWRHISTLLTVAVTSVVMSCYPGWRSTRSCVVVTEFCLQKKAAIFLDSVSHNNIVACSQQQTAFTCSSSLHSKSCSSKTKLLPRVNATY